MANNTKKTKKRELKIKEVSIYKMIGAEGDEATTSLDRSMYEVYFTNSLGLEVALGLFDTKDNALNFIDKKEKTNDSIRANNPKV